jgi:hypothetical protein
MVIYGEFLHNFLVYYDSLVPFLEKPLVAPYTALP